MSNQDVGPETTLGTNGLALMWKMIAVTASDSSPFGATLITEILKVSFGFIMLPICYNWRNK